MDGYLQRLVPDMLQDLKDNRNGSPSYLGENYTNEDGILVNDTCHDEWDKILDNMIFLWRESNEETCKRINPYYDEYDKAFEEFTEKYGILGDKLRTEAELENDKKFRVRTGHFMDELPQYKEMSEKYFAEEKKLEEYRNKCKDDAIDLLKEHFYALRD